MMISGRKMTVLLCALFIAAPVCHAQSGDVEAVVARAAQSWLMDWAKQEQWPDPQVDAVVLPNRRPAPECGQALKVFPADTSQISRLRFSARCPDGKSETYTVRASVRSKALVATEAIPAGKVIDKGNLKLADVDVALTPDATRRIADIAGSTSQRPLRAGQVVQVRFLKTGEGVRRGQVVQIVSRQQQFQISAKGTVMQKAEHGALVKVRNDASGKMILARVVGGGIVDPVMDVGAQKNVPAELE